MKDPENNNIEPFSDSQPLADVEDVWRSSFAEIDESLSRDGIDTTKIDQFRQGVEVTLPRHYSKSLYRVGSGDKGGRLKETSFGGTPVNRKKTHFFREESFDNELIERAKNSVLGFVKPFFIKPSPPINFSAFFVTSTTMMLSWTEPVDNNVDVVEYEVQQRLESGVNGDYVTIATVAAPNVILALDYGLLPDTSYRFRVRSKGIVGNASVWAPDDDGLSVTTDAFRLETSPSNSVLSTVALSDGGYIIGGSFTSVVEPENMTGTSYRVDLETGMIYQPFFTSSGSTLTGPNLPTSGVAASLLLNDGSIIIGGTFRHVFNIPRAGLARINADGSLHPWNPGAGSSVKRLALHGSTVIVGGDFTVLGGAPRRCLGSVPLDSNAATSWNPAGTSTPFSVRALAIVGTQVVVGGNFSSFGGQTRNNLCSVDIDTGSLSAWNPAPNGFVFAAASNGTNVIVAGTFSSLAGGQSRGRIAEFDMTTNTLTAWNPSATGTDVVSLYINGSEVIVGGSFSNIGGQARANIAALDLATGSATAWNPGASGSVYALEVNGADVLVGGAFTTIGGAARNYVGSVSLSTGLATSWAPEATGSVLSLLSHGSNVLVGGSFIGHTATPRLRLARINSDGTLHSWNPGANGSVQTIELSGTNVVVGGSFTGLGGGTGTGAVRNRVGMIQTETDTVTSWNPNVTNGVVKAVAVLGNDIIIGGSFTQVGGITRNRIARYNTSGTLLTWNPNISIGGVNALSFSGTTLIVGGSFNGTINGVARNRVAALTLTSNTPTSWNPNCNGTVNAIDTSGGNIVLGGIFTQFGGTTDRLNLAAFTLSSNTPMPWNPGANSMVLSVAFKENDIIVGGIFSKLGGVIGTTPRSCIGSIEFATGDVTAWNPGVDSTVQALSIQGTDVIAGGLFITSNSLTPTQYFPFRYSGRVAYL